MSLRTDRCHFTAMTAELICWINTNNWQLDMAELGRASLDAPYKVECAMDEWTVKSPRWVKVGLERVMAQDRVHSPNGLHPHGLACDLLLYINGDYLADGSHPIWARIDTRARSMDSKFGLGLTFNDANHLSYGE